MSETACKSRDKNSLFRVGVEVFVELATAGRTEQLLQTGAVGLHQAFNAAEFFEQEGLCLLADAFHLVQR